MGLPWSIRQLFLRPVADQSGVEPADLLAQLQIQIDVISTFHGGPAGHFALKLRGGGKDLFQKLHRVSRGEKRAVEQEVESRLAAHGAKVDHRLPGMGIAQEGGDQVLGRVHFGVGEQSPGVGLKENRRVLSDAPVYPFTHSANG